MRHSSKGRMESSVDNSLGEVTMPCVFTFVPVVQKLPIKSCLEKTSGDLEGKQEENIAAPQEETTREAVLKEQLFRAVYSPNSEGRREGDKIQPQRNTACAPPRDPVSLSESAPSVSGQSENTSRWGAATMEAAANKHTDISQRRYQGVPGRAEVSSGCFFKTPSQDRSSPTNSADLFPTPASSRESILSACSDKDASPISGSRTISPCSSVYSGIFTPSVLQVKKHFLAPGSSLISLPQSCRSSYESLSCPLSPPPRHRPPLTRLSLLTAILRKGRLPILSSSVQRPYTPCWPVNNVTLSHCSACSAASSVASIPLELSSRFSSTASIDSQSDAHRDPSRCATAPPHLQLSKTSPQNQITTSKSNSVPRWQQVISPPPRSALKTQKNNNPLQQVPLPVCSSIVKSVSPINCHESYVSVSKPKSPVLPSICLNVDNRPNKRTCLSPEPAIEVDTGVPQKWTRLPNSSLIKLQSLSQQLKSPSSCSSKNSSPNVFPAHPASPPPHRVTAGKPDTSRFELKKTPVAHLSHCLSPSRYTHIPFPGWPSPGASPSPSPTPTPSPAPPIRELTPSPSLSLRSTPSPRPGSGISDSADREGKKRKPHKIKSSYKSLAAIPTNTLLLDQQVIDEQVERGEGDTGDRGVPLGRAVRDTHKEMCSPAQLRKESEELYAVIDEILGSTIPPTHKAPVTNETQKNSTFLRTYGRETKYASLGSLCSNGNGERKPDLNKTKPGIIRPMTAVPRLTAEDRDKKSDCSPFRQFVVAQTFCDSTKGRYTSGEDGGAHTKGQTQSQEENPSAVPACDLYITEPEEHITSHLSTSKSFCPAERKLEAFQAQI